MRIIGIDPGTICCGYGIIEIRGQGSSELLYITSGDIRMKKKDPLPERLKLLYKSLTKIIDEYKPSHLCMEKIFYHKSIRSALVLGSARGIVMLLAAEGSMPLFEYNPTELKMALTGYGRAEKRQVKEMVIRILNLRAQNTEHPETLRNGAGRTQSTEHRLKTDDNITFSLSEDAADALALCICHINLLNRLK